MARLAITVIDFPTMRQRAVRRLAPIDFAARPESTERALGSGAGASELILADAGSSGAFVAEPAHEVLGRSL